MSADPSRVATLATVILVAIAGWAVAAASGILTSGSRILIYLLANLVLTFDAIDLIVRVWLRQLDAAAERGPSIDLGLPEISRAERNWSLKPYAIIASVHNEADDIDVFLGTLLPFKDVTWLIDDASDDTTLLRLRSDGWRCVAGTINRKKPAALLHLLGTLPREVQTIVIMDPDVRWVTAPGAERATLERVISDLQRSGTAALTPRVLVRRGGWLVECQALEYELACGLGRRSLRDLCCNSGVSIYRRSALESALQRHSLSVYAEDLENSLLLLAGGDRIYYDDRMVVETRAKDTWRSLFSQRVGWAFGCARLLAKRAPLFAAIARRSPLGAYQYMFYLVINGIVLLPMKLVSICILLMSLLRSIDDLLLTHLIPAAAWNEPLLFGLWYVKSLLVLLVAILVALPAGERARHIASLPFYGFYALLQYAPMTVGYLNLLTLRLFGFRLYADHYAAEAMLDGAPVLQSVERRP